MSQVFTAGTVVADDRVHRPGWLEIGDNGNVAAVGSGLPPDGDPDRGDITRTDLGPEAIVVPGFVDIHTHGGGGASYPSGDPDQARHAVQAHRAHGTTTTVASLVSAHPEPLLAQVRALAPLVKDGTLAGIHLEGPWLSQIRCGAHDPAALRPATPAEIDALLTAADGTLAMATLAPELPGALDAVTRLRDAGVVVAIGHTDADYNQTRRAIEAGATVATHLFNGMRPVDHRAPGPVLALLEAPQVTLELILDDVHLHPALYREVLRSAGPDRIALVTDAMAAATMPDGPYLLGHVAVTVTDGVARVDGKGNIAGSTVTADVLFRHAIRFADAPAAGSTPIDAAPTDAALLDAVRQTSTVPARVLRLGRRGLSIGSPADLAVLGSDLRVRSVHTGIPLQNHKPTLS